MTYKIIQRNKQNFIELEEVKNYLRISHDYDNRMILSLIDSAIENAENFLRIKLIESKIEFAEEYKGMGLIKTPLFPLKTVERVTIFSESHEIAIHADDYLIEEYGLLLKNLPLWDTIIVQAVVGICSDQIPQSLVRGIIAHVAEMYDNRGVSFDISQGVRSIYQQYRRIIL